MAFTVFDFGNILKWFVLFQISSLDNSHTLLQGEHRIRNVCTLSRNNGTLLDRLLPFNICAKPSGPRLSQPNDTVSLKLADGHSLKSESLEKANSQALSYMIQKSALGALDGWLGTVWLIWSEKKKRILNSMTMKAHIVTAQVLLRLWDSARP